MTDALTANIIQAAVNVERNRIIGIIYREALWLNRAQAGQPQSEQNAMGREIQVLLDVVDTIRNEATR